MELDRGYHVQSAKAAKALSRPWVARLLTPFMIAPTSLSAASSELDVSMTALLYWVKQFLEFGILDIRFQKSRAGRPVRFYEAVAKKFIIPANLMPFDNVGASDLRWFSKLKAALEIEAPFLIDAGGLSIELASDHSLNMNRIQVNNSTFDPLAQDQPAVLYTFSENIMLDNQHAKEFQSKLWELFQQYRMQNITENSRRYIILLGLSPTKAHEE
ncbi:MAG: hypothetical protein RLZZ156_972 [Deinococcota bacterium]|jgi:hypothetical protein